MTSMFRPGVLAALRRIVFPAVRGGGWLRRRGILVAVAMLVLSPAIGLTISTAKLASALLVWSPPHVVSPERLVRLDPANDLSELAYVRSTMQTLDVAAYGSVDAHVRLASGFVPARVQCASAGFFPLLGVAPYAGRLFSGVSSHSEPLTAVLSFSFSRRVYGTPAAAIGQAVSFRRRSYTVVGIAPPGFRGIDAKPVDLWIPLVSRGEACSLEAGAEAGRGADLVGRLRQGRTVQEATVEVAQLKLGSGTKRSAPKVRAVVASLRGALAEDRDILTWLGYGVALVLGVAFWTAATLLQIHVAVRKREVALRAALGATALRVTALAVGDLLTVVMPCGVVAWWFTSVADSWLAQFYPVADAPHQLAGHTVLLAAALGLVVSTIAVIAPAFRLSRSRLLDALLDDTRSTVFRSRRQGLIVAGLVAVAMAGLIGAGMFNRSIRNLRSAAGFEFSNTVAITIDPYRAEYSGLRDAELQLLRQALFERLKHHPSVVRVALAAYAPLDSSPHSYQFLRARPVSSDRPANVGVNVVSSSYFAALGVPIIRGGTFPERRDGSGVPAVIVSEGAAREVWKTLDIVGRCAYVEDFGCARVVGVSASTRSRVLDGEWNEIFVPFGQVLGPQPPEAGRTILVRLSPSANPGELASICQLAMPRVPITVESLEANADPFTRSLRLGAAVFGLVGGLTFALALVGVCASLGLTVRQRIPEFAVRTALGATPFQIFWLVMAYGTRTLTIGWIAGVLLGAALTHTLRGMMFGVAAVDVETVLRISAVLLGGGVLACALPAVHAVTVDSLPSIRRN